VQRFDGIHHHHHHHHHHQTSIEIHINIRTIINHSHHLTYFSYFFFPVLQNIDRESRYVSNKKIVGIDLFYDTSAILIYGMLRGQTDKHLTKEKLQKLNFLRNKVVSNPQNT
jgi:hypothetical protein